MRKPTIPSADDILRLVLRLTARGVSTEAVSGHIERWCRARLNEERAHIAAEAFELDFDQHSINHCVALRGGVEASVQEALSLARKTFSEAVRERVQADDVEE